MPQTIMRSTASTLNFLISCWSTTVFFPVPDSRYHLPVNCTNEIESCGFRSYPGSNVPFGSAHPKTTLRLRTMSYNRGLQYDCRWSDLPQRFLTEYPEGRRRASRQTLLSHYTVLVLPEAAPYTDWGHHRMSDDLPDNRTSSFCGSGNRLSSRSAVKYIRVSICHATQQHRLHTLLIIFIFHTPKLEIEICIGLR